MATSYPQLSSVSAYNQQYPVNYGQAPPVLTQPYVTQNPAIIVVPQQNKDVQHGCHFLLWLITGGLWTPCWIAACCGCCCERPC